MDSRKVLALLALGLASAASNAVVARGGFGPGHPPHDPFLGLPPDPALVDTDGDGKISKAEIEAARGIEFKAADTDGDDSLTLAELKAWLSQRVEDRFKALDRDGNNLISAEELVHGETGRRATMLSNLLKQGDLDGGGSLSPEEFRTLASSASKAGLFFAGMDENGDGKVSKAEYLAPPPHHAGHPRKARPATETDNEADDA
ncbi:EF-hand domain-containing protein [Methylotetracoccus oryzae]|uniref:EF-hand domain-containing protein n=1 Tax=Methylotetracoccus oryzae TaxID=1919059 RepID=UPI0013A55150|nr:EF-hand domain-containing protein [Methylotetracoccus oryzae]